MTEPQTSTVSSDFARWYHAVEMGGNSERLQRKWASVKKLADEAKRSDVETMIRIALKAKQRPASNSLRDICKVLQAADEHFEAEKSNREFEVLCAGGLAALLTEPSDTAAAAALAITTAELGGRRKQSMQRELGQLAERSIVIISEHFRERPDLSTYQSDSSKLDFDNAINKIRETQNWDGVASAFALAATSASTAIANLRRRFNNAMEEVNNFIAIQDEELQTLWWLIGKRSWDFDCAFADLPSAAQPLVLGKEFAEKTTFLPGPASAKPLLSHGGLRERGKLSVPSSVNACDSQWLTNLVGDLSPSPVTQPIHFAMKRRLETGETDAWIAGWAGSTGIEANYSVSPLTMGLLFYRERLLSIFPGD